MIPENYVYRQSRLLSCGRDERESRRSMRLPSDKSEGVNGKAEAKEKKLSLGKRLRLRRRRRFVHYTLS